MAYTTPPQFTPTRPSMRRDIDFGIISESFQMLVAHWKPYTIAGAVSLIAFIPSQIVGIAPLLKVMANPSAPPADPFANLALQYGLLIPALFINMFLAAGVSRYTLNVVQGFPADTSDIWEGFRDIPGYFATSFLAGLVGFLGIFACCIGTIVTCGLMMFAVPAKVAKGITPTAAISESWNLLKDQWLMAGVFYLVLSLISGLGSIACFVGQAFTYSFMYIGATILYCRYNGIGMQTQAGAPISPYPRGPQSEQPFGTQQQAPPEHQMRPPGPNDLS